MIEPSAAYLGAVGCAPSLAHGRRAHRATAGASARSRGACDIGRRRARDAARRSRRRHSRGSAIRRARSALRLGLLSRFPGVRNAADDQTITLAAIGLVAGVALISPLRAYAMREKQRSVGGCTTVVMRLDLQD